MLCLIFTFLSFLGHRFYLVVQGPLRFGFLSALCCKNEIFYFLASKHYFLSKLLEHRQFGNFSNTVFQ